MRWTFTLALPKLKSSQEEGLTVLNNLTKKNVLSESIRKGIAEIFNNPRRDEDGKAGELRNLYQLYNAGTEFLTSAHITDSKGNELGTYESRRFERAHSTSQKLLKAFDLAAGNETRLKGLVTPAKNGDYRHDCVRVTPNQQTPPLAGFFICPIEKNP